MTEGEKWCWHEECSHERHKVHPKWLTYAVCHFVQKIVDGIFTLKNREDVHFRSLDDVPLSFTVTDVMLCNTSNRRQTYNVEIEKFY